MHDTKISAVEGGAELRDFINLPWSIYADYSQWVPPLKKEVRRLLDIRKHPFWEFSERVLFIARRGSETVGRIAGIVDRNYNQFHSEKMGAWGFFECIDDSEVAAALFSSVETWIRQKGMISLRGPLSPSTNYETGFLIEGFEYPPALMMPYTPPYYPGLVEACGFAKAKDLVAFLISAPYELPEWMDHLADRVAKKKGVEIRRFRPKEQDAEFDLIREIYNDSWANNWGFVPLTENEMRAIQRDAMEFTDPDLSFFISYEDEPVAICVIFPDMNPLLKRLNGRIGLIGALKALLYRGKITGLRCVIFGVKDKYRQMGLPMLAFQKIYEIVRKKEKYRSLEMGWTLEDNEAVNALATEAGARPYKKYRIFEKSLLSQTA